MSGGITVSGQSTPPIVVRDDSVTINVSGGIGPQGPAGDGGVTTLQGLAGALTLAVVGGTVAAAGSTITITVTGGGGGGSLAWADITGKPATFTPSAHASSHATGGSDPLALAIGQITGLQAALDGKQAAGSYAAAGHTHAASVITFDPSGLNNITTATVQAALAEVDADLEERISATQFNASFSTGLTIAAGIVSVSFGTTSTTVCVGNDARLSDAREWSADTISQAEAEAGTATTRRAFTAQRVLQAIAAWWAGSAAKTKLDGIAVGATANQTDAYLLARANHTGTQAHTTITGLGTLATQSGTFSGTSSGTNTGDQTITLTGDVTGSGTGTFTATLSASGVTAGTYRAVTVDSKGRVTAGSNPTTLAGYGITDAAASGHTHSAADITSGVMAAARLASSGTASASTFLRGDGTWAAAGSTNASDLTSGTLAFARMADPTVTTPAQIAANQNNYAGFARGINRFTTDAARDLTGMVAGNDGEVRLLVNVGSFALTIKHQSTSSTSANRFTVPWAGDCVIPASGGSAAVVYDATSGTWRVL